MKQFAVILLAAGQSQRFGDPLIKKPFASLNGKAVWLHSAERFIQRPDVGQIVVVVPGEDQADFKSMYAANLAVWGFDVVGGGKERGDSVRNGLEAVDDQYEFVAIHDGARPCLSEDLLDRVFSAAKKDGNVIPAVGVSSTIKRSKDGSMIDETVNREHLYLAQTPQVFRRRELISAFASRSDAGFTDEAQLMEMAGHQVRLVAGSPLNIKITDKQDVALAQLILKAPQSIRFDAPPSRSAPNPFWR